MLQHYTYTLTLTHTLGSSEFKSKYPFVEPLALLRLVLVVFSTRGGRLDWLPERDVRPKKGLINLANHMLSWLPGLKILIRVRRRLLNFGAS